jgi:hypothetical protein
LSAFFYNNGTGVSLEDIHNSRYRQLVSIPLFYDMSADQLMMEVHRAVQQQMRDGAMGRKVTRTKSVYQQRNLGTIKQRKKDKRQDGEGANPEMMMRILRMRFVARTVRQAKLCTVLTMGVKKARNRGFLVAAAADSQCDPAGTTESCKYSPSSFFGYRR